MQTVEAREELLSRARSVSPDEFEVLCSLVLDRTLRTTELSVTPSSQDGGIDIEGRLSYDWFAADYGVQVKRYAEENTVGSDRVHRLAGALLSNNYHLGTFITTSSYTRPAVAASNQLPIQLVSGDELAEAMVSSRIGVTRTDDGYELRAEFWDDLVAASDRIPAGDVPLASNFDRIRAVLTAMKYTDGTANALHRWVKENRPQEVSSRHVYINANAAAVLGLARTEPPTGDRSVKRWGLTGLGAQLITTAPGSEEETQTYAEAIRGVELIQKLLVELRNRGELKRREIEGVISSETTGLSDQSISRRGSSVRNWLQRLPEIQTKDSGSTLTYLSQ